MRSTVSYMLGQPNGQFPMSHPDYEQQSIHHGCLLVLLRGIGPSKPRSLQKIFEKVRRVNNVKINDSLGNQRDIWVRYIHDHPVENNDWGDFQTHRRLLGLITIGKFDNQIELNELCRLHESLKVKYLTTLYDSRCILFGPTVSSNIQNKTIPDTQTEETINNESINVVPQKLEDVYTTPSNFKSTAYFYEENDSCANLEQHISEFVNSIFWILESKRLERSRERVDKVGLILAPFEKKDFVGLDLESRTSKKRSVGRVTKNLADLTLQAGLVNESLNLFHSASETLCAINDSLWLGAAEEGLCSASAILLYPGLRQTESFHRNFHASLQDGVSPQKLLEKRRKSSEIAKTFSERTVNHTPEKHNSIENSSNSSSSSSVSSILTTNSSGSSSSSTTLQDKSSTGNNLPPNILTPDEIVGYYKKAIINYSKYRHACCIETEAALKAARICIEQQKNLDVAMFLQNVLYINLNMPESEKIKRFEVLTDLYHQIGYHKKAAFCQRLAAWKYVAQGNQNPDWSQSYRLMLESFPGYLLSLDPLQVIDQAAGWPVLQIDLLKELIMAAKRLGHSALATRHMTFLLQTQWKNMSTNEQREMAIQLQNLSAQCEGSPVPLVLENGIVIPPANLTDMPYCMHIQIKDLGSHLRPHRIIITKVDSGPFLFTPIHFNSIDRRQKKSDENKVSFYWVQNELVEVQIKLKNNLPFELTVNDMRLLTTGIVFEALPQTIILQPEIPTTISLHGTPIEYGKLEIQGYSTHALGVKSNCRLKHMKNRNFPPNYIIEVIPALPRLSAHTSLPQTTTFSNLPNADSVITSASLTIFSGETSECIITLQNESPISIEHLEVQINSNIEREYLNRIFKIDQEDIKSRLPILANSSIQLKLEIFGDADFLSASTHGVTTDISNNFVGGPQSLNYSTISSGHNSLPSRVSSPTANFGRRADLNSSFRSSNSGGTMQASLAPTLNINGRQIEAQIRLRYSGGEAMQEGYCRECAIAFNLEILPSVKITSWDVLPAEIPSQFYLVLDVSNHATQEMCFNYTTNKNILIEAKESCRVPIPVDRCSIESMKENFIDTKLPNAYDSGPVQIVNQKELVEKLCSQHISDRVKLSWSLTGTETHGLATLKGITLSNSMIDLITVAPLQWNIYLNEILFEPQSEVICVAGQCIKLKVEISNQSQQELKCLAVTVQFYQDYQNGVHNYHLETRIMMTGPNQIYIPVLNKNDKVAHECSVVFFTPGRFKANIQANITQSASAISSSNSNSSTIPELYQFNLHDNNVNENQHMWRFIPPVEVTVIESC